MKTYSLTAKSRARVKDKLPELRRAGKIPAVLYGHGIKNEALLIDRTGFEKVYAAAGTSNLVDLTIEKLKPRRVLISDMQYDPVTDQTIHVDFYQVRMDEKIEAEVEVEYTGISPAVKEESGVLVKNFDKIKVRCLPGDLPSQVTIDISRLKTFDDAIKVSDLKLSDKVEILHDQTVVLTTVTPPRSEEELKQLEEEVTEDVEAVEGVKKEEPVEGEAEAKEGEAGKEAGKEGVKKEAAPATAAAPEKKPAEKKSAEKK